MYSNWSYSPETPNLGQNLLGSMSKQIFDGNQIMFYTQTSQWIQTQYCLQWIISWRQDVVWNISIPVENIFPACCSKGSWRHHRSIILRIPHRDDSCVHHISPDNPTNIRISSKYRPSGWSIRIRKSYCITTRRYMSNSHYNLLTHVSKLTILDQVESFPVCSLCTW